MRIAGPILRGSSPPIHSIIEFNDRQILAIDVAAGLTPRAIQTRLDEGGQTLNQIRPGVALRTPAGSYRLPAHAHVARLQVIAGPQHAATLRPAVASMHLEDLEWITYSSQRSPADLWYFVRDLTAPAGVEGMFAWDMLDRWEIWKQNKSFYRGGVSLSTMMFAPHAAVAEWDDAAAAAPTERALHELGLPPLRDWPIVALDHRSGTEVGDLQGDAYQIMPWPVPVAIRKTDTTAPGEHFSTLWSMANDVAWKLEHSLEAFIVAARQSALLSLHVVFEFLDRDAGPPLTLQRFSDGGLAIGWDSRLQEALAQDSFEVEALCGEIVAQALTPPARQGFLTAWEAAPAGVRVDGFSLRQQVQRLPEPLEAHTSVRSDVLRQLGEHLADIGVEPGVLDGADATRFESHTVFPWLIKKFHDTIAELSADGLLGLRPRPAGMRAPSPAHARQAARVAARIPSPRRHRRCREARATDSRDPRHLADGGGNPRSPACWSHPRGRPGLVRRAGGSRAEH